MYLKWYCTPATTPYFMKCHFVNGNAFHKYDLLKKTATQSQI